MGLPGHKVAPRPQKQPEFANKRKEAPENTFCCGGGPDSWYIDNRPLYFHQMILDMIFLLKRGVPDHKAAPSLTTKLPELAKIYVQNHPKNAFCCGRRSGSCYIGNTPLYFQEITPSKAFRAQEAISKSQSGSPITKAA